MKDRFWIFVASFIGICFVFLSVGGLYFLTLQESQAEKTRIKKTLSRENAFYLRELKRKLLKFNKSAETSLEERNQEDSSLFAALVFVDLENRSVEPVFSPNFDKGLDSFSEKLFREFLKFANTLDWAAASRTSFHFLSDSGSDWIVLVTPLRPFPKSRGLLWAGVIKSADFFKFSGASDRDALIINSQGRLFFSFQSHPGPFPSKPVLKKFLKKAAQKKKTGWYVRRRGGDRQGSNLFHLKPWPGTNLFVMSGGKFSQPLFVWTRSSTLWLLFCFSLGIILFFGLVLFIRPLRAAYETLREEMIYMTRTGKRRFPSQSKNPYLDFISPEEKKDSFTEVQESTPPSPLLTFQDLLAQEGQRFKKQFPGFNLTSRLSTSVNLVHFQRAMKKILQELLSNAIEAMGSAESQNITVTVREEGEFFILSVRDFGPGLREEEKKKVFKLYYSTKSHLGVGLNLVQSVVSSHGGTVKLFSPDDGGLEVQVSLPLKCFSPVAEYPLASLKESAAGLEKREPPLPQVLH